ncbi:MAG: ribonuclease Z, partial [Cytophagales bacterium]|nr:ribonuclease Z [Cytophagales bacterium]
PPAPSVSFAYCSDTLYDEGILEYIKSVTYLFHEATFTEELLSRANSTYHTTARQAGHMAKLANANELIIGHFSSRYADLNRFLQEAQSEFPKTKLAIEGHTFDIS